MSELEVHFEEQPLGYVERHASRGGERISFRYDPAWLSMSEPFSIDPELYLDSRVTSPSRGGVFGAFADCAPDRWGRTLMQRHERRRAETEDRGVRTLSELDYVLGVSDHARPGALRFRSSGRYVAPGDEVPPLVRLGALFGAAERLVSNEEDGEDLALLLGPGSSLGGARPKASILDATGRLSIAKFPRPDDEHSVELWEWVALELARRAGIRVPEVDLVKVKGKSVLLSRRFDRRGGRRVHFASALTLLGLADGDRASYPEIADILQREGSAPRRDAEELFRRMVLNICIANVDDHLRNHGFLRDASGWTLSPAYDLNPVPAEIRPRILTTNVTLDDPTGSLDAARTSATYFGLSLPRANTVIDEVRKATFQFEEIAIKAGASKREIARMRSAFLTSS